LTTDGEIDRKKLGQIVFGKPHLLEQLTQIVHPAVFRREAELETAYGAADPQVIMITEAAILIETGKYKTFQLLVVTVCSEETQISRAMKRDLLTREEVLERLARQLPATEKQKYADYVVNTDQPKSQTAERVKAIFEELRTAAIA
jgi:dephospho-CoA kinase